jgi:hypothetical protein
MQRAEDMAGKAGLAETRPGGSTESRLKLVEGCETARAS